MGLYYSKSFPQPLLIVETQAVEKPEGKNPSTPPVEKLCFSHMQLWINFRCGPKQIGTFPHNFVLRLLRLPKPIYRDIYLKFFNKKGT